MAKKITSKALAGAIGATFLTSLASVSVASAAENPFAVNPLTSGYQIADAKDGNCGGMKGQEKEAHCGGKTGKDAHCGGKQADPKAKGKKDGSCGEAKCGANKGKK
jgi:uncharacterized low-complexity protein